MRNTKLKLRTIFEFTITSKYCYTYENDLPKYFYICSIPSIVITKQRFLEAFEDFKMSYIKKYCALFITLLIATYSYPMERKKRAESKEVTEKSINFLVQQLMKISEEALNDNIDETKKHALMQKLLEINIKLKNDIPKCKMLAQDTKDTLLGNCNELISAYKHHISSTKKHVDNGNMLCSMITTFDQKTAPGSVLALLFEWMRNNNAVAAYCKQHKQSIDAMVEFKTIRENSQKIEDFRKKIGLKKLTSEDWNKLYRKYGEGNQQKTPLITLISWGELSAIKTVLPKPLQTKNPFELSLGIIPKPFEKKQRELVCQLSNPEFINSDALPFICYAENVQKGEELTKKYGNIIQQVPDEHMYHFLEYLMAHKEQGNKAHFITLKGKTDTKEEAINTKDATEFYKEYDAYQTKLKETINTTLKPYLIAELPPVICQFLSHEVGLKS